MRNSNGVNLMRPAPAAPHRPEPDRVRFIERCIADTVEQTLGLAPARKGVLVLDLAELVRQRRAALRGYRSC